MKIGAQKMLDFAQKERPDLIILTEGSDSCGVNVILDPQKIDNKDRNKFKPGMAVATALLKMNGFKLFSHKQVNEIEEFLKNNSGNN